MTFNSRHKLSEHYDEELFECHCGSVFKFKSLLSQHQQRHNEKSTCEICQKQFSFLKSLNAHWRRLHLKTHGKLESSKSKFTRKLLKNDDKSSILATLKVLNRTGPFICDKCGSRFSKRTSFSSHQRKQHGRFSVFCDLCSRSFVSKFFLTIHMNRDHLKLRPFECNVCLYKSLIKVNLKIHMLTHGPKSECKICHKLVANMNSHLRNHVKVQCSICRKFIVKATLGRHMKIHRNRK